MILVRETLLIARNHGKSFDQVLIEALEFLVLGIEPGQPKGEIEHFGDLPFDPEEINRIQRLIDEEIDPPNWPDSIRVN